MEGHQFIIPMIKNQTACGDGNLFLMRRSPESQCQPHSQVDLSCEAYFAVEKAQTQFPTFNRDRQYFTACFSLPQDKVFLKEFELIKWEERVENAKEKPLKVGLALSQPFEQISPLSYYCQVCQAPFQNYVEHVNDPAHQNIMHCSPANQMIEELQRSIATNLKSRKIRKSREVEEDENAFRERPIRKCTRKGQDQRKANLKTNMSNLRTAFTTIDHSEKC